MSKTFDLIIRGGTIVNQNGIGQIDIGINEGRISELGTFSASRGAKIFNAEGLHVLPGVIDSHVHFREPGAEESENLESGSRAAVLGGVTGVFEMPNTNPPTISANALTDKIARAQGRMFCDFAFYVGASRDNIGELPALELREGTCGIKVFMGSSTGNLLVDDPALLRELLTTSHRRVSFHCEDEARLNGRKNLRIDGKPESHSEWRDIEAAIIATRQLLQLARESGRRVHILHVSTGQEMQLIAENRDVATAEVTPHHLFMTAHPSYERLGTRAQMNPPLRDEVQIAALWNAVSQGVADTIGSDHAPHLPEAKAKPYPASPSGIPGVQTLVPLMLNAVNTGLLSLTRFVDLTSSGPCRVYGIARKGRIARGYDADLTLVDLKARRMIEDKWISSRCGWTSYDGWQVTGWPVATLVRGHFAMRDGEVASEAKGEPISFIETLAPATTV